MHFDLTTPKGLKITLSDTNKIIIIERGEQEKEDKRVEKKIRLAFLLIFASSTLETLESLARKKTPVFFNAVFTNPDIYMIIIMIINGPSQQ